MTTPSTTTAPPQSTAAQFRQSVRPWFDDFLSFSSLSLPASIPELSLRIQRNLYVFRVNYLLLSLLIFLLTLIPHPITFIVFFLISIAWFYLVFSTEEPLVVLDFEIGQRFLVILLSVVTLVALAATSIWWNIFLSVFISALVVSLHAILRTPDDIEESPYGALLSVVDEDEPARGPYTLV
ncbi:hypothetical protein SSX86_016521 [Deinandra increscens subsp. villosa]|uniref:PRA1 family protein n=1 Tax=Deinandra increscens subsp. villosa TaxID=3103831 RepID=A0AAP0D5M0_9ASTR